MESRWSLTIDGELADRLLAHLFPGDGDEHGAVLVAGIARTRSGVRLLGRELFVARDGIDYVAGERGYRMLTPGFVNEKIRSCRDRGLAYIAIHNHGGADAVSFSGDDLASHERGYPALLDIAAGPPVGAVVFAKQAAAGDIWTPDRVRRPLSEVRILGRNVTRLHPCPSAASGVAARYDRQARLFGDRGQSILGETKVGVIGAGGVGMLCISLLGRLGVGQLVVADPERVDPSNLPRLPEATTLDAMSLLTGASRVSWIKRAGERLARSKVSVARRIVRRANPDCNFKAIRGTIVDPAVANAFSDCDYLFLAADSHQARLVFNALIHQYLIPGVQIGSKIQVDQQTGDVDEIFSIVRPVKPQSGCLLCNELIHPHRLTEEALDPTVAREQRYLDDDDAPAPSVISLNALGAAAAVDDFMLAMTGLRGAGSDPYRRTFPARGEQRIEVPRRDPTCPDCGRTEASGRSRGDAARLPCWTTVGA